MLPLNFFSFQDNTSLHYNRCSRNCTEYPFVVNCAGITSTNDEYRTFNGTGREDWYLLYIISGTLYVGDEGSETKCTSGHFVIFPPKYKYNYFHKSKDQIECFWMHFSGSDVEKAIKQYDFAVFPAVNKINHDMVINARYSNMFNAFAQNDKFRDRELSILCDRLLLSLAKRTMSSHSTRSLLNKSLNYINDNYNKNMYISQLATIESLSLSRYNALFRQVTGMSPSDYIKQLRLAAACELLLSTDMAINLVGEAVGYPNQCFFSKIFKKSLGVTPTEYRQNK